MGKSDIRILPPLVNGKLSGVLEFGIDYVEITEKIFKNEDSNFLVQIIWWGETKPLFLRSKKIKFSTKDKKQVIVDEQDGYTVGYEVRTRIKLFNSYLSKCDEVEVAVIDSVKNEIVGSTFLKDLIQLVYNGECFTNSIISDCGDAIGKITCHFKFREADSGIESHEIWKTGIDLVPVEKWNYNDLKINLNLTELYSSKDDLLNLYESSRTDKENKSAKSVNVHYNSPVTRVSGLTCVNSQTECLPEWKAKTHAINADSEHLGQSPKELELCAEREVVCADSENCSGNVTPETAERDDAKKNKKTFPPIKAKINARKEEEIASKTRNSNLRHSAKVTNKKKCPNNVRDITARRFPNKSNPIDGTVRGVKKDKGNPPEAVNVRNSATVPKCNKTSTKLVVKPMGSIKTFAKVSREISKLNKLYLNGDEECNQSDLENVPVKENEDGEREMNEKVQSPPRIIPVSEQSKSSGECKDRDKTDTVKIKVNNKLFFDLNDPIEKLYYETFFEKAETLGSNEFEIAELLNNPGNNYIMQANPQDERGAKHLVENQEKDVDVNCRNLSPVDVKRTDSSSNDEEADGGCGVKKSMTMMESCGQENPKTVKEYKMDCHRCKYYKKLSELDKIIDALKNFEAKLRTEVSDEPEIIPRGDYHGCGDLPEDGNTEDRVSGDVGANSNESDYSKDSDFIEFRQYLSKR